MDVYVDKKVIDKLREISKWKRTVTDSDNFVLSEEEVDSIDVLVDFIDDVRKEQGEIIGMAWTCGMIVKNVVWFEQNSAGGYDRVEQKTYYIPIS